MTSKPTAYAYRASHGWVEIVGAWASDLGDHDADWLSTATPAERAKAGAVEISDGQLAPHAHQHKIGEEIADLHGLPVRRGVFKEISLEQRKADTQDRLRAVWREHELGGFTASGGHTATDEEAQRRLLAALANGDRVYVTWEVRAGQFILVDGPERAALAAPILKHIEACANHAYALHDAIAEAASHTALTDIDLNGGWPT